MDWAVVFGSFVGTSAALISFILVIAVLFGSKIKTLYRLVKDLGDNPLIGGMTKND